MQTCLEKMTRSDHVNPVTDVINAIKPASMITDPYQFNKPCKVLLHHL